MDAKVNVEQVEKLHEQIEELMRENSDKDEQILALRSFIRLKHVDPDFLPA